MTFSDSFFLALPLLLILYLLSISLYYSYLAAEKYDIKKSKSKTVARYEDTLSATNEFLGLVTYLLSTSVSLMNSSLDLIEKLKALSSQTINSVRDRVSSYSNDIERLATENQTSAAQSRVAEMTIRPRNTIFYRDSAVYVPITTIFFLLTITNVILISQDILTVSYPRIAIEAGLFLLASYLLIVSKKYKDTTYAYLNIADKKIKNQIIYYEKRREYIAQLREILNDNYAKLSDVSFNKQITPQSKLYFNGLANLEGYIKAIKLVENTTDMKKDIPLFSVTAFINKVIEDYQDIANKMNITIKSDVPKGLSIRIETDELMQLIRSVIDNAIRFSQQDGEIRIQVNSDKQFIEVNVWDDGIGISKEKLSQLFQPFSRSSDSLRYDPKGIGLNLITDKVILARMGGSLQIDSEYGTGTKVKLLIPLIK